MDRCHKELEFLYCLKEKDVVIDELKFFDKSTDEIDSYYIQRKESEYCVEYNFETLPELKKMMDDLCMDKVFTQDVIKVLLVAALKNKPQDPGEKKLDISEKIASDRLPEYIYTF